jgi:uroporphyrin-III C-methyltransferase
MWLKTTAAAHVILAGAGPGDPELISIKAMKAIAWAEVILYDALVNTDLLTHAAPTCKLVFVGKRKGTHSHSQDEINQLLMFYASRYKRVLRLKGGDPFVFGRGHEESQYLTARGVTTEIIPGISSAIAGPAAVGIPVTRRGVSESFWVITGTLASGNLSTDLELAARSASTVVVLMGMDKLRKIITLFLKHRSPFEPVAVIQNATLPTQRIVTGSINTITAVTQRCGITAPAVIVIGKVVQYASLAEIINQEPLKMKVAV